MLSLLAAAVPAPEAPTSDATPLDKTFSKVPPMAYKAFSAWLQQSNREELAQGCLDPAIGTSNARRQQIRNRLLELDQAPQPFEAILANATALLRCGSPDSAAVVLQRTSPGSPQQRRQWLLLRWRAAASALDHRLSLIHI